MAKSRKIKRIISAKSFNTVKQVCKALSMEPRGTKRYDALFDRALELSRKKEHLTFLARQDFYPDQLVRVVEAAHEMGRLERDDVWRKAVSVLC